MSLLDDLQTRPFTTEPTRTLTSLFESLTLDDAKLQHSLPRDVRHAASTDEVTKKLSE